MNTTFLAFRSKVSFIRYMVWSINYMQDYVRNDFPKAPFSVKTHCANSFFFQKHYTNNETNTY